MIIKNKKYFYFSIFVLLAFIIFTTVKKHWTLFNKDKNINIAKYNKTNKLNLLNIQKKPNYNKDFFLNLPRLNIEINFKSLAMLTTSLTNSLSESQRFNRLLFKNLSNNKKSFKTTLTFNNKVIKGLMSYRGEGFWHRTGSKKSFKIKLNKNDSLFGYRKLNFDAPKYIAPYLRVVQYETARELGLIAPRSFPIWIKINNIDVGIYFFHGHYSREMLTENNRPEGDLFGERENYVGYQILYSSTEKWKKYASRYGSKGKNNVKIINDYIKIAKLEGKEFIETVKKKFNLLSLFKYHTLASIFNSVRQDYHNIRIYHDPVTLRYELIPNDLLINEGNHHIYKAFNLFWKKIFEVPEFLEMKQVVTYDLIKNKKLISKIKSRLNYWKDKVLPLYSYEKKDAEFYRKVFNTNSTDYLKLFNDTHAQWIKILNEREKYFNEIFDTKTYIANKNDPKHLTIDSLVQLRLGKKTYKPQIIFDNADDDGPDNVPTHYTPKVQAQSIKQKRSLKGSFYFDKKLLYHLEESSRFSSLSYSRNDIAEWTQEIDKRNNLNKRAPIPIPKLIEPTRFTKTIKKGTTLEIKDDWIIPLKSSILIEDGVTIKIAKDKNIIVQGSISFHGKPHNKIKITELLKGQGWGAIIIQNNPQVSVFKNVIIEHGNGSRRFGQYYSGTLSAYNSDIILKDSIFRFNHSDDALNVKYSISKVENTLFKNNDDDCIDFDFSEGEIKNSHFLNNKGDGVDLSYAKTIVEGNYFFSNGDKGISVGEKSRPILLNNRFESNPIGIAVKDISVALIKGFKNKNNKIDLSLYNKKPYFGGGLAILDKEYKNLKINKDEKSKIQYERNK